MIRTKIYIYIITCKQFCKIGIAKDPERRMADLLSQCPPLITLKLYKKFKVPNEKSALRLERWCHFELKKFWSGKGEWFKVKPQLVSGIISKVICKNFQSNPKWQVQSKIISERLSKRWKEDDAYRIKIKKVLKKNRTKGLTKLKLRWKDPKFRKHLADSIRKLWKDPKFLKAKKSALKKQWEDPVFREKHSKAVSKAAKKLWSDPKHRAKMIKSMQRKTS